MKITLAYYAQVRLAAGRETETVDWAGAPDPAALGGEARD